MVQPATEDEPVGRLGVAQRSSAQLAMLQDFGVTNPDLGSGGALHDEPDPADEVLAEVDDAPSRRRGQDFDGSDNVLTANLRTDVRLEMCVSNSMSGPYTGTGLGVGVNGTYHSSLRRRASIV